MPSQPTSTPVPARTSAAWIFLPALGAPLAHAPVLRWNLMPSLRRPIGRRLFGENKTWRGALIMTCGTVGASVALHRLPAYTQRLPEPVAQANPVLMGTLLGGACWLGELPNSFLKRRLGIAPGEQRASPAGVAISIFDQADWVPMAWLLVRPLWAMSVREAAQVFLLVAAIHVPINLIGYAIGARTAPL
jgi:hypothetical protein